MSWAWWKRQPCRQWRCLPSLRPRPRLGCGFLFVVVLLYVVLVLFHSLLFLVLVGVGRGGRFAGLFPVKTDVFFLVRKAEAARQHGLTVAEVDDWREKFLLGAENALRSRPRDEEAVKDEQIKKLKQKIGDLVLDNDILREALKPCPLDRKTSDA